MNNMYEKVSLIVNISKEDIIHPERVIKKVQDSIDNYVYDKLINALVKQIGGCTNEKYTKL